MSDDTRAAEFLRPILADSPSCGDEEDDQELVYDLGTRFAAARLAERGHIIAWLRAREEPELDLVIHLLEKGDKVVGGYVSPEDGK